MESSQNSSTLAFDAFLNQDYKSSLNYLNKLKSAKDQNEKYGNRLQHNILIAEFLNGKMTNLNGFISKMDDFIQDLKSKSQSKTKDQKRISSSSDEEIADKTPNEAEDDTFFRYNYAAALHISGKKQKAIETLKELFQNKDIVHDYLTLKICLLLLDMSISTKDYNSVKTRIEFFYNVRKYIPEAGPIMGNSEEAEEFEKIKEAPRNSQDKKSGGAKLGYFNPMVFGLEIHKAGDNPSNFCITEFKLMHNIYEIYLLISLKEGELAKKKFDYCKTLFQELTKMMKDKVNEKGEQISGYSPSITPYLNKHINFLMMTAEASLYYHGNQLHKCMKTMNYYENPVFLSEDIVTYNCYQLNNIACCHMKMKKYNLAAHYLSKCIQSLQKLNKDMAKDTGSFDKNNAILNYNGLQQYPYIMYNYALCLLQIGKHEEAGEAFASLAQFWPDNARVYNLFMAYSKIWYRAALCHLNRYHQILDENQKQKKNSLYSSLLDIPNYTLMSEEERSEQGKAKKTEDIEHKETIYYTRYVLNSRDTVYQQPEEDMTTTSNKFTNQLQDMNKGNEGIAPSQTEKTLRNQLDKAHKCFRNAAMISKRKRAKILKEKESVISINIRNFDKETTGKDDGEETKKNDITVKAQSQLNEVQEVLQSALVNLGYTSLCLGETNSAINFSKEAIDLPFTSEDNKYCALMYLVEAYCIIGDHKEVKLVLSNLCKAMNQTSTASMNQNILTSARNVLGVNQTSFMEKINNKVVLYTNLATVHILNNNFTGAQNALNIAYNSLDGNLSQTPIPLLNLLIYLNLKTDKPDVALQLLKRRRVINASNNKLLLRIVK